MSASTRYLVSIHDVMPDTLDRVEDIFRRLRERELTPVTLLVVPGRRWQPAEIARLRALIGQGAELAGHGWRHEATSVRGIKHRLHSALISKNVAEHLALDRAECIELMDRCHAWFGQHELPAPTLYVPPAWALGPVPTEALSAVAFERFETLSGIYDSSRGRFQRLPLLGFEVDAAWQSAIVRSWNAVNLSWGRRSNLPIRLGIHPDDFSRRLADQLSTLITAGGTGLSYRFGAA